MASTYSITSSSTYDGRKMTLSCTQTKNIANNTSTIKWTLTTKGGNVNYYSTGPTTVTINGKQVYYKDRTAYSSHTFPAAKGSTSGTLTVSHNSDGNKSISVSLKTAIYYGSSSVKTDTKTWKLDQIPRAAKLVSATNFNDNPNSVPSITYSNLAGNAVSTLQAYIYAEDDTTVLVGPRDLDKSGTSYLFTDLTDAEYTKLRNACGNASSTTVKYYIKTIIGSNTFWSSAIDKTFTIVDASPTVICSAKDIKPESIDLTGNPNTIIKGYNEIEVSIVAAAKKGATIKETEIFCGSSALPGDSTGVSGSFINSKSGTVIFAAQDNRGFKTTKTIELPMIDYTTLTNTFSLKMSAEGSMFIKTSGTYFNGNFGAADNELKLYYRYKTEEDNDFTSWIPIATENITINKDNTYEASITVEGLDYQKTYLVQTGARDLIKQITATAQKVNAFPIFDWGERDFNFNVPVTVANNEGASIKGKMSVTAQGKSAIDDGKQGIYLAENGVMTLQHPSYPEVRFYSGTSTTDGGGFALSAGQNLVIYAKGNILVYNSTGQLQFNSDRFKSNQNDVYYLGDSSQKWKSVYAVNGTIQTSDRDQKENIIELDNKYEQLFDKLKPVTFELKGSSHDRVHVGFIAQDVKESMDEVGLTDREFAAYCVDTKTEFDEETNSDIVVLDEKGNPIKMYSLRYTEFIALNTHMIQKQQSEIDSLKSEIADLKELLK